MLEYESSWLGDSGLACPIELRLTLTLILGTSGGVRGVVGIGGEIGVDAVGETGSSVGGFLRVLRGGRGGAEVSSVTPTPNSAVGREKRDKVDGKKLFTGSSTLNAGIVGDGGEELGGEGFLRRSCRFGGGSDGRSSSS